MKPWHEYTEEGIQQLAEDALNSACLSIQDSLRIESGDVAGIFFSGDKGEAVINLMKEYIRMEILFFKERT